VRAVPKVLTTAAVVRCPHGGQGSSMPAGTPLLFAGGAVLADGDQGTIALCTNQVQCKTYKLSSMQLNSMYVGGKRIMLVTDFIQTDTGFPLAVTESHNVVDQTVPSPLAPGATPTTPPELREDDKPAVTVTVAPPPFSKSGFANSGQPVSLPFAFSLTSLFPRRWTLWRISPGLSQELTAGLPPGITVAPSGGAWAASPLTVAMTVTGAFVATMDVATHSFVLTAVNHRGLWGMAEAKLAVAT
jgi:hypothetical protein